MEFKSQRNVLENTQCFLLHVATTPREEEMWASARCTAEWYDQCMNLTGKAKTTAMKQGKTEWNQARGAWVCWQEVEVDGLLKLTWLEVPEWSPDGEDEDLSQALHLTVTPQLWAPLQGQASAVKIQLHTQTRHSLDSQGHARSPAGSRTLTRSALCLSPPGTPPPLPWLQRLPPNPLLLAPLVAGTSSLQPSHTEGIEGEITERER